MALASRLYRASHDLPNPVRAASIIALPVLAFATNAALGTRWVAPLFAAFVALTLFALWAHLPVFAWDGPFPFSDRGIHVGGEIHPWDAVAAVEPGEGRNLAAVLTDGRRVTLRVRGERTWDEFRTAVLRHKPEAVAF